MRVLIAGCGYVGTELGRVLGREGYEVWGLRRDPAGLPEPIRPVAADLVDPDLSRHLPRVDRVVYAASADASTPEGYRAAYVDGVRNLQAALAEGSPGVERFLFTSSTAVYGDAEGEWVDEDTPPAPESFRGSIVLEGEAQVRGGPFPGVILRLGGIYGPGRTRLLERVRSGEARCPEGDPVWSNRVHRDDAARMCLHLLESEAPAPVYVGVDDEPAELCEVYRFVAGLLGVPFPAGSSPGGASPAGTAPGGPQVPGRRTTANRRCSNRRLRASGFQLRFPSFREGYRAMVEG